MRLEDIDDATVTAILHGLGSLRSRLDADLSVVTAAVDADRPEIACDVLTADSLELQGFSQMSGRLLAESQGESRNRPHLTAEESLQRHGQRPCVGDGKPRCEASQCDPGSSPPTDS